MIYIKDKKVKQPIGTFKVKDLIESNYSKERNAFIGQHKDYDVADELYIVTWERVASASDPSETYLPESTFIIKEFVDLEISICPRKEGVCINGHTN